VTTTDRLPSEVTVRWRRADGVLWRRTVAGVVVLPAAEATTEPYALSGAAAGIWELLSEPKTTADVIAAVAEQHTVAEAAVAGAVNGALDALLELGALCRG
jgi:Coenzyme PQQ synthesis protein D (PqqD)